ncbi:MAG: UDP-N-acetylmuramoyl-L-alanine--D-glutamate ligase, partial [Bacteroidales bacterium]|nr:UDP-N-acetylmuramoyl-L-alanine--D-glutamate ligase [Bacteroidales bacterium]
DTKANLFPFSQTQKFDSDGAWLQDNEIIINVHNTRILMTLEQLALQGKHNVYNTMAGGIAARLESIRKETIKQSLFDFDQIEHRMERVNAVRGVTFINDSKATNVNSAWYALETIKEPVIWIVGGIDKGNDYKSLIPLAQEKVKAIVCLGVDNEKIIHVFSPFVETIIETRQMSDAVEKAFYLGTPGDVVLLSPACASFDLFENFEDRGNQFKRAVQDL